jgi:hypothetical protein
MQGLLLQDKRAGSPDISGIDEGESQYIRFGFITRINNR